MIGLMKQVLYIKRGPPFHITRHGFWTVAFCEEIIYAYGERVKQTPGKTLPNQQESSELICVPSNPNSHRR
ncbi:hypothetical protein F0562_005889 [Nyssa sinensis]|uniref:Uncharacterized protein n=1 Tax=Nyssa sinensis TaxID=561372 RepID=A0A5J5AP72_9ASTE|nr:hypothetical protein F0562_005889 [Nyssa sinensis]